MRKPAKAGILYGLHLRVGATVLSVKTFGNNPAVVHHQTTDHRVRAHGAAAVRRHRQAPAHENLIHRPQTVPIVAVRRVHHRILIWINRTWNNRKPYRADSLPYKSGLFRRIAGKCWLRLSYRRGYSVSKRGRRRFSTY